MIVRWFWIQQEIQMAGFDYFSCKIENYFIYSLLESINVQSMK